MRRKSALLACALLACARAARAAGQNPGVTAAPVLQIPMGSRALGMGSAFTAVASDISALYYNPAGLARLNAYEAAATYTTGLADNTLQNFGLGGPLPFAGISGNGYAGWGSSLLWAHNGTIEVNTTNLDGSPQSTANLDAGSDVVATLGYAERVAATPIDVKDGGTIGINHYLGLSGKYIDSSLVQQYSARTFSMDAGYLANSPETGLSLGLSALNVGGSLRYIDASDPLPTTFRGGLAYQGGSGDNAFTLAADSYYLLHEREWRADAGVEYFLLKSYGIRVGYQFLQDSVGLTAGFGLRWRSRILIDYAWSMSGGGLADQQRFTVTYRFGGVAPSIRSRGRQPVIDQDTMPDAEHLREGLDEKRPSVDSVPVPSSSPSGALAPGWIY